MGTPPNIPSPLDALPDELTNPAADRGVLDEAAGAVARLGAEARAPSAALIGIIALIVADLMPVVGVLLLGWEVFPIILLYWLENVVIGVVTVLKMVFAAGGQAGPSDAGAAGRSPALSPGEQVSRPARIALGLRQGAQMSGPEGRAASIGFFCFHYGMFTLVHGVFVFVFFGLGVMQPGPGGVHDGLGAVLSWWFPLAFLSLCVSHGISFWRDYLGAGEYRTLTVQAAMLQPYGRVVVMHLTIIFGAMLISWLGTPRGGRRRGPAERAGAPAAAVGCGS